MKLKSGCIFWPQIDRSPEIPSQQLTRDIHCDVAILGAGISGALAGYHLVKEGVHVAMVDRRQVGQGSTSASTGLLQYEIDTPLVELIDKLGRDRAVAAYRASLESVLAFEPLVAELGDTCGLQSRSSLYLAKDEKDAEKLRAEHEARRSMQIDVKFLSREVLKSDFNISRPAALWSQTAFDVDPYRLTRQLVRKSIQKGLELFCPAQIVRYEPSGQQAILHASNGVRISARKVIFAMGYETMGLLPADLCQLASTYALVSEPVNDFSAWRDRCLIWETARPYLYARTTEDNRIIVGGEDEEIVDPHRRDQLLERKAETLLAKFSKLLPDIPIDTTCAWAGTFGQTKDGLPYIGTLLKYPHCYFALGYGGNGITFSLLAAEIIRNMFLGRPDARARLFGFDR